MRRRDAPLVIPARPNWLSVDLGDRGVHAFRVPRAVVRLELSAALRGGSVAAVRLTGVDGIREGIEAGMVEMDAETTSVVRAAGEVIGACIGECWRHEALALEAIRQHYPGDTAGLRAYGDAVMDELDDAGYTAAEQTLITEAIVPRILEGLAPPPAEVAARAASFPDA